MKTWVLQALMALIFSLLGIGLIVAAFATGEWPLLAGLVFLLVGLVMAWWAPAARREQNADGRDLSVAEAGAVPFERVAELIRERLAGTAYAVDLEGSLIRVHADLADAEFLGWASANRVKVVRGLEVVAARPGVALTRGFEQDLEMSLGVGRLSGGARVQSGRSWSSERRIEWGVGKNGSVGRQVDVRFSSKQIQGPVNAVLKETGWYAGTWASLPAESKGAVIVGIIGGVGGGLTLIAVGVAALMGKFG